MTKPYPENLAPMLMNEALPAKRPVHLLAGMSVIAEYSSVEALVSVLLATLAGGDNEPVAAIYSVLRQGQIQAKALDAVSRVTLEKDDQQLLRDLMKVLRGASDARDKLAHRLWFYDDQLPEAVVLTDPALAWMMAAAVTKVGPSGATTEENANEIHRTMRNKCEVWALADLEEARQRCVRSFVGLTAFNLMVQIDLGTEARAAERQKVETVVKLAGL